MFLYQVFYNHPKWPQSDPNTNCLRKLRSEIENPTPIDRSWDPATGHRPDFGGHGCGNSEMPTDESQPSNSSCSSKATETYLKFHHPTVFLVPTLYIILQYLVARRECFGALGAGYSLWFFRWSQLELRIEFHHMIHLLVDGSFKISKGIWIMLSSQ